MSDTTTNNTEVATAAQSAIEKLYRAGAYSAVKAMAKTQADDQEAQDFSERTSVDKISLLIGIASLSLVVIVAYLTLTAH